jgi:hypothetical protein
VTITGSSRPAVLSVILFFIVGAVLLTRVDVAQGELEAAAIESSHVGPATPVGADRRR